MQILNNIAAMFSLGNLNKNKKKQEDSIQKLATGEAFPSARYGAETYAISEKMRVQIRALDQNDDNTKAGGDLLRTAEGALQTQLNIMRQIKAKVIDAANDSNTDEDRVTIQKEIDQFYKQIEEITHSTRYNGIQLLVGGTSPYKIITDGWQLLDEPVMLDESAAMNVIPDNFATLDGIEGPFDIFTEYEIPTTTEIPELDLPNKYSGGGEVYTVSASSISDLDGHCLYYNNRYYVFTTNPSQNYPSSVTSLSDNGTFRQNSYNITTIDLNTYNSVSDALNRMASLAGITFDITTENGVTIAKTSTSISSYQIPEFQASSVTNAIPASGIGSGRFSGGVNAQQGDGIDIPDVAGEYAKYTANISSVSANTGFTIRPYSDISVEVLFVNGNSAPSLNSDGRWEVGLDWTGTATVGYYSTLTIDSSKNMTIQSRYIGTTGNSYRVVDGISARAASNATVGVQRLSINNQYSDAYANVDLSNYNSADSNLLEQLIDTLRGKAFSWTAEYIENGDPESNFIFAGFIDSTLPAGDYDNVNQAANYTIDLNDIRTAVQNGTTIAEAFADEITDAVRAFFVYNPEGVDEYFSVVRNDSGDITSLKFRALYSGDDGNYSDWYDFNLFSVVDTISLRRYEIPYGDWFDSNPDFVIPDDLDGKGFRVYCATDANQWFNFLFRNGSDATRPESGSADSLDYRTIVIDVSEVTDATSFIQAIYDQGEPEMQSINHYLHLATELDEGKLVIYDARRYTASQLRRMTGVDYQERGAKIADGALDNVVKGERILYAKTLVIQDTEKSNSYITLHIPQMTFDHMFHSIPEPDTIRDYPVTSKKARTALLGPPEPGIIDSAIDYILDALTDCGAQMQRLDNSNSNIVTKRENAQASESTIRNLDMAKEMVEQTKLNILSQASQAMLAQSNQNLSNVLELIQ